eukprot:scaffold193564_cov36-Attheya_sp.AAC.1
MPRSCAVPVFILYVPGYGMYFHQRTEWGCLVVIVSEAGSGEEYYEISEKNRELATNWEQTSLYIDDGGLHDAGRYRSQLCGGESPRLEEVDKKHDEPPDGAVEEQSSLEDRRGLVTLAAEHDR